MSESNEIVNEGVHNYSQEKDYIWPTDEKILKS